MKNYLLFLTSSKHYPQGSGIGMDFDDMREMRNWDSAAIHTSVRPKEILTYISNLNDVSEGNNLHLGLFFPFDIRTVIDDPMLLGSIGQDKLPMFEVLRRLHPQKWKEIAIDIYNGFPIYDDTPLSKEEKQLWKTAPILSDFNHIKLSINGESRSL